MAMDTQDIKLITGLQDKMEERLVEAIKGLGTGVRAKIESEVNRIDEMDKIRNSRINTLEKETIIGRWAYRNPKVTIIATIILIASIALGSYQINVKRTIEKIIPIEFTDEKD